MSKILKAIPYNLPHVFNIHEIRLLIDSYLMDFPVYDKYTIINTDIMNYTNIMEYWTSEYRYFNEPVEIESYYSHYFNKLQCRKQLKFTFEDY